MSKSLIALSIFSLLFLSACGSTRVASECESPVVIRFGEFHRAYSNLTGFKLTSPGSLSYFGITPEDTGFVTNIDNPVYCKMLDSTRNLMLKVQALNVPADINYFVEYHDPRTNLTLRVFWVPWHQNEGNEQFSELFTGLMNLVPDTSALKKQILDRANNPIEPGIR